MVKFMRMALGGLSVLLVAMGSAFATPTTQFEGTATILGNTYNVSVLFDPTGSESFNALSPTITFTNLADAIAAGDALITQFGSGFDWNPFNGGLDGGRIVYAADASNYSYVTICLVEVGCSPTDANGPFTAGVDDSNAFTFIQFSPVTGVPEPITLSLFGTGLAGAVAIRRRKNKSVA
jgi:PEP-CTERM motif-containing protein